MPAGRRSGKTEVSKRFLVLSLWDCLINPRAWSDPRFFCACPTRDQVKRVWWQDLKALTPKAWLAGPPNETDMCIRTKWGAELWAIGLDKPQRMEGVGWDGGMVDEYADTKPGAFDANIRPALADRNGWCWLLGVPDRDGPAQVEYEAMYNVAASGKDPEWGAYAWPSADILPDSEVESARRRMDPRLFDQEFGGKFILAGGRAFPDFDQQVGGKHVRSVEYDPSLPLCWALDFNIDPMCSGIIQHHKGEVRVIDELVLPDTKTDSACDAFIKRCRERGWKIDGANRMYIYGDASGSARDSTSGESDWIIVRRRFPSVQQRVPRANPPIKDTLNALNAKVLSAEGNVNLVVHPRCTMLIDNFRTALWPSPDDFQNEHCLAWLRYFTHYEYPIRPLPEKPARVMIANPVVS